MGYLVVWKVDEVGDVVILGGFKVFNWIDIGFKGIYLVLVLSGIKLCNFYVNGKVVNYVWWMIECFDFNIINSLMLWELSDYDWIMEVGDFDGVEIWVV